MNSGVAGLINRLTKKSNNATNKHGHPTEPSKCPQAGFGSPSRNSTYEHIQPGSPLRQTRNPLSPARENSNQSTSNKQPSPAKKISSLSFDESSNVSPSTIRSQQRRTTVSTANSSAVYSSPSERGTGLNTTTQPPLRKKAPSPQRGIVHSQAPRQQSCEPEKEPTTKLELQKPSSRRKSIGPLQVSIVTTRKASFVDTPSGPTQGNPVISTSNLLTGHTSSTSNIMGEGADGVVKFRNPLFKLPKTGQGRRASVALSYLSPLSIGETVDSSRNQAPSTDSESLQKTTSASLQDGISTTDGETQVEAKAEAEADADADNIESIIQKCIQRQTKKKEREEAAQDLINVYLHHPTFSHSRLVLDGLLLVDRHVLLSTLIDSICSTDIPFPSTQRDFQSSSRETGIGTSYSSGNLAMDENNSSDLNFQQSQSQSQPQEVEAGNFLLKKKRREAADILSSIAMRLSGSIADSLRPFMPKLIKLAQDEDAIIRSHINSIFASAQLDSLRFFPSDQSIEGLNITQQEGPSSSQSENLSALGTPISSNSDYSRSNSMQSNSASSVAGGASSYGLQTPDAILMIQQMLDAKQQEVREAAISALICFGPLGCSCIPQLMEICVKDKYPSLRLLSVKAMEEIGSHFLLPFADQLLEASRKESDKHVKKQLQSTLKVLQYTFSPSSSSSSSLADEVDYSESKVGAIAKSRSKQTNLVTKYMIKEAIQHLQLRNSSSNLQGVSFDDLKRHFETNYPAMHRDIGPARLHLQLKIVLKKMMSKNIVHRTPAIYSTK